MNESNGRSSRYPHIVATFEHEGKRYVVAEEEASHLVGARGSASLSPREHTVLQAASTGQHDKLIAYELGVAHSTVRVLFFRAMRKLGARSRAEALDRFRARSSSPRPFAADDPRLQAQILHAALAATNVHAMRDRIDDAGKLSALALDPLQVA